MTVKPISAMRDTKAISEECNKSNAPVFLRKKGQDDLVIMSVDAYAKLAQIPDFRKIIDEELKIIKQSKKV